MKHLASGSTGSTDVWPTEDPAKCKHPRKPSLQHEVDAIFQKINARLHNMHELELIQEEFIGARLYTGPMFEKYNTVLRGGAMNMTDVQPSFLKEKFEKKRCACITDTPPRSTQ